MSTRQLSELEPTLERVTQPCQWREVDSLAEAHGVMFVCPSCTERLGGRAGVHMILCWFRDRSVPDGERPLARWSVSGTGLADITLAPSINCDIPYVDPKGVSHENTCKFHGWIENGVVRW